MHQITKLQITSLNPHLICVLCGGYYIDASTIIECLHSFCRSCIVRYLESNKFCPICEVQVHKTRPLLNIRSDQTLQDIVYMLVPGLFQREMRLRREFYSKHPGVLPTNPEDRGEVTDRYIYSPDETICLSLEYAGDSPDSRKCEPAGDGASTTIGRGSVAAPAQAPAKEEEGADASGSCSSKRFLRCPAAVTVGLLKRLIRGKYGLELNHALDILYGDSCLCDEYSLVDLAYIYNWRRKGPMRLKYRIYQYVVRHHNNHHQSPAAATPALGVVAAVVTNGSSSAMLSPDVKANGLAVTVAASSAEHEVLKEVQLEISESGVMSVSKIEESPSSSQSTILSSGKACDDSGDSVPPPATPPPHPMMMMMTTTPPERSPDSVQGSSATASLQVAQPESCNGASLPPPLIPVSSAAASPTSANKKPTSPVGYKTLKSPPKTWNPSVSRVASKRSASSSSANSTNCSGGVVRGVESSKKSLAAPSPPKAARFFKVRNSSSSTAASNNHKTLPTLAPALPALLPAVSGGAATIPASPVSSTSSSAIASVTESPVQEVAVNLSKVSAKKIQQRQDAGARAPSPPANSGSGSLTGTNNCRPSTPNTRPSSAPAQLKPPPAAPPTPQQLLAAAVAASGGSATTEEMDSKLRSLLNPGGGPASSGGGAVDTLQLRLPWMNLVRGPAAAAGQGRSGLPHAAAAAAAASAFLSRSPMPAHLISSYIASHAAAAAHFHPSFHAAAQQMTLGLSPPAPQTPTNSKKSPSSSSSLNSNSASVAAAVSSCQSGVDKSGTPANFATPTFSLNSLPPYPANLWPLMTSLQPELLGSLYSSYPTNPFGAGSNHRTPAAVASAATSASSITSVSSSVSSNGGGKNCSGGAGFHLSLPPTVTTSSASAAVGKSSSSPAALRSLLPRRSVAPPLIPIRPRQESATVSAPAATAAALPTTTTTTPAVALPAAVPPLLIPLNNVPPEQVVVVVESSLLKQDSPVKSAPPPTTPEGAAVALPAPEPPAPESSESSCPVGSDSKRENGQADSGAENSSSSAGADATPLPQTNTTSAAPALLVADGQPEKKVTS